MSDDLWGSLLDTEKIRTPYGILQKQAELLSEKTNNVLTAFIKREGPEHRNLWFRSKKEDKIRLTQLFQIYLSINSVYIPNYDYAVLRVDHPLEIYPLNIKDLSTDTKYICENESELLTNLRIILGSPKLQEVIKGLIVLSTSDL